MTPNTNVIWIQNTHKHSIWFNWHTPIQRDYSNSSTYQMNQQLILVEINRIKKHRDQMLYEWSNWKWCITSIPKSARFIISAQLFIRWPLESIIDWLKFNPFKLKAIVLRPKKKCRLRELLKLGYWKMTRPK